ncbi:MAG: phosphomannomutase/phosphoglucomutase, partial [Candidatus Wildermuthbacteria bacterium]|nr:phosphomannomutase/phosphoglucomutase [Candidatus Wildermuthbacteria bacterium]
MKSNIFRAYDIRGICPDEVNAEVVFDISGALARYLNAKTIVVGEDGRNSSPELREAVVNGVMDSGCNVLYIGRCTTPLFYFSVNKLNVDGGIMVTASHNPPQYNGLKIVSRGAVPIAKDSGLIDIKNLIDKEIAASSSGKMELANTLDDYIDEVIKISGKFKNNLKIVIDVGNGVASITLKPLLEKLGFEYTPLYFNIDGSFPNHLSDISREENLRDLREKVLQENADLGVAFDGDA